MAQSFLLRITGLFDGALSVAFKQTWLVFNGAVHTWNIYKHLMEDSQAKTQEIHRMMPLLREIFQRLLEQPPNFYEDILKSFTEFCSRAALVRSIPFFHSTCLSLSSDNFFALQHFRSRFSDYFALRLSRTSDWSKSFAPKLSHYGKAQANAQSLARCFKI